MIKCINKDIQVCMFLVVCLSNFGICFYNYLYEVLDFNYFYKVFLLIDFMQVISGVCGLGICGCVIFMLFKEVCILLVDELDVFVQVIYLVNIIVNINGYLKVYNIDYIVIVCLLVNYKVFFDLVFVLCGSGGMVKVVVCVLKDVGFICGYIVVIDEVLGK